MFFKTLHFRRI